MRHWMPAACAALALTAALTSPVAAQHGSGQHGHAAPHATATPYAGFQGREAAGISATELADLRAGRGMGLALPAELNGYPGPLHALEMADALQLAPAQRAAMADLIAGMRAASIPLGEALLIAERALDDVFRRGTATDEQVEAAAATAALARGRLRAAHLRAHLATRAAMTEAQRQAYTRLRGYGG